MVLNGRLNSTCIVQQLQQSSICTEDSTPIVAAKTSEESFVAVAAASSAWSQQRSSVKSLLPPPSPPPATKIIQPQQEKQEKRNQSPKRRQEAKQKATGISQGKEAMPQYNHQHQQSETVDYSLVYDDYNSQLCAEMTPPPGYRFDGGQLIANGLVATQFSYWFASSE